MAPDFARHAGVGGPIVRRLGLQPYTEIFAAMRAFTDARAPDTADELWLLEHPPVFTQGQAGRPEHLLATGAIPLVQSNRGGQVTYHGPGQLVVYVLLDLQRLGYGVKSLVTRLEHAMIATLAGCGIAAHPRAEAPGVYVRRARWPDDGSCDEARKIGSLGLRISRGCSYHGLALNVDMDLEPFSRIEPCGLRGLRMTQVRELLPDSHAFLTTSQVGERLVAQLCAQIAAAQAGGIAPALIESPPH